MLIFDLHFLLHAGVPPPHLAAGHGVPAPAVPGRLPARLLHPPGPGSAPHVRHQAGLYQQRRTQHLHENETTTRQFELIHTSLHRLKKLKSIRHKFAN